MAATSFERELIRQRKALTRIDRRTEAHLIGEYRELYKRLDWQLRNVTEAIGQARATGRAPNVSWLVRQTHYEQLMLDVERETTRFAFTASQRIANAQSDAISQVDGHMRTLIESALSPAPAAALAEVSLRFGGLPSGAFERLVGNASNGRPLGRLLHQISPQTTRKAARALQQGIALGLHPREVARDFRAATGATLKRSLLISRTEMMRAYREANREAYMASEVVKGWTWISALDDRTCPACWFMHGTEHSDDESLDGHIRCRCDQAPITKSWAELGFPGIPDTRPQITPGTEVFDRLGEEAQRKIVGPGALDALQRGEIVKQDLIARPRSREWGTMRRTSSLKDAKARASQRAASAEARAKAG